MPSIFESPSLIRASKPFRDFSKRLEVLFPTLEWDLKRAGYVDVDAPLYLSIIMYVGLSIFIILLLVLVAPIAARNGMVESYPFLLAAMLLTTIIVSYLLMLPRVDINKRSRLIDNGLEYMLKDIQIQLRSGVPLFDTLVNVSRGQYGECSKIADGIVKEVESGRSIAEVLDDVGMWSPSEYLRKVLWQIVNAVRSGSDMIKALEAIARDIRLDKEAKISMYSKELNLWSLIYMMLVIIAPSMGTTLLVVLSSFVGGKYVSPNLLWGVFIFVTLIQIIFITFLREKRPHI
jgi:pilus assembly protein TadC